MNLCCIKEMQKIQDELSRHVETLSKFAGKRESAMEEAAYRRAEIILDVMKVIIDHVNRG